MPIRRNGRAWNEDCVVARVRNDVLYEQKSLGGAKPERPIGYPLRSQFEARMNWHNSFGEDSPTLSGRRAAEVQVCAPITKWQTAFGTAEITGPD